MKIKYSILILTLAFSLAHAGEDFKNPDALEKELTTCLTKNEKPSTCMEIVLGSRLLPGNEQLISVAKQMDEFLLNWLAKESVYKVHPIRTKQSGDIYEVRTYIIEDTSGAIIALKLNMLNRLGKWYMHKFNLNSSSDKLSAILEDN